MQHSYKKISEEGFVAIVVPYPHTPNENELNEVVNFVLNFIDEENRKKIATIGTLTTNNIGIEYLIANIVSFKPIISHIIITPLLEEKDGKVLVKKGKDTIFRAGEHLVLLYRYGLDGNKIKNGDDNAVLGRVYRNIDKIVEVFRERELIDLRCSDLNEINRVLEKVNKKNVRVIKVERKDEILFEGSKDNFVFFVEGKNILDAWKKAVREVFIHGKTQESRYGKVKEIIGLIVRIENPKDIKCRFPGEKEYLEEYMENGFFDRNKILDEKLDYTYGERIFYWGYRVDKKFINQLDEVVKKILEDETRRDLIVSLWDPRIDNKNKHVPCLTQIQFFIRNNKLYVVAYFRSHDILKAAYENWYAILKISEILIEKLRKHGKNLELGEIISISSSAHIYESDFSKAYEISREVEGNRAFTFDRLGYFTIERYGEDIIIKFFNYSGELIEEFKKKIEKEQDILDLVREVYYLFPNLKADHLAYLALELYKALLSKKLGKEYKQDFSIL